jgi:hypothetical protein
MFLLSYGCAKRQQTSEMPRPRAPKEDMAPCKNTSLWVHRWQPTCASTSSCTTLVPRCGGLEFN